jgi:hypothetical protein
LSLWSFKRYRYFADSAARNAFTSSTVTASL